MTTQKLVFDIFMAASVIGWITYNAKKGKTTPDERDQLAELKTFKSVSATVFVLICCLYLYSDGHEISEVKIGLQLIMLVSMYGEIFGKRYYLRNL